MKRGAGNIVASEGAKVAKSGALICALCRARSSDKVPWGATKGSAKIGDRCQGPVQTCGSLHFNISIGRRWFNLAKKRTDKTTGLGMMTD